VGELVVGELVVGEMVVGELVVGELVVGELVVGEMVVGKLDVGKLVVGFEVGVKLVGLLVFTGRFVGALVWGLKEVGEGVLSSPQIVPARQSMPATAAADPMAAAPAPAPIWTAVFGAFAIFFVPLTADSKIPRPSASTSNIPLSSSFVICPRKLPPLRLKILECVSITFRPLVDRDGCRAFKRRSL